MGLPVTFVSDRGLPVTPVDEYGVPIVGGGGARTTPLLIGTSGDSKANTGTTNTDASLVDIAFPVAGATVIACNGNKFQTHLQYPRARLVANGGVSGDTTTQWLARDSAGAGATRKAITDVLNLKADAVIVDVGVNDFATVTAGTRAATVATAVANAKIGLARLTLGCSCVIFRPQGSNNAGATDLAQTRLACLEYNAAIETFIETFGYGRMFYLDSAYVNSDGSIPAAYTYDGVHQSWTGGLIQGKAEALILASVFGASDRRRFDGVNLLTNQMMASTTSPGYGTQATGVSILVTNCTRQNALIEQKYGIMWQTCEFVPSTTGVIAQLNMPYDPTALAIAANDYLGFEFDWFIEGVTLSTTPNLTTLLARIDTYKTAAGRVVLDEIAANSGGPASVANGEMFGHCSFPLWRCQEASAALTTSSLFRLQVQTDELNTFKVGIANWRMCKMNTALVTA